MCKTISTASNRQKHLGARGPTYPRGRSWLSAALAAGFSSNITESTGDENEDPFADLDGDFQGLMYIGSDEELPVPVCFNADVNEQQLLESLNTSDQDTIILESDDGDESDAGEDDNESPPTSRKELPRIS